MTKTPKRNSVTQSGSDSATLQRVRKNVRYQALLAVLVVVLTVVIIFAITAAWYTNIAQTGGLVFEVEQWGFEGEVTLEDGVVLKAAPGDEGIIGLTAVSQSDGMTAVGINVSKVQISDPEIHKRLYFYVDTAQTKNGETMERVYLNNLQNYTYLLFSNGTLQLTETVHNDAQLKWHWVYDVLGYYVQGTLDQAANTIIVSDYLRPIEYEYDEASTTFETDSEGKVFGSVVTVDGTTTLNEFLYNLSLTDGYAGTIGTKDENNILTPAASIGGYYPVSVDEYGQGVWAYLCNYSEIETHTEYDTQLAAMAEKPQYTVRVTITAQNTDLEMTEINTPAALADAIAQAGAEGKIYLQLVDDLVLSDKLVLSEARQVLLDLNGHSMQVATGTYTERLGGFQVNAGSALTITNGTLTGTSEDNNGHVVTASGAQVTLSNVKVENAGCAVYVRDDYGTADSTIRMVNCEIATNEEAIYLSGNGDASAEKTRLVVENSTITSKFAGIYGNGNITQSGTDTQIINSSVSGFYTGIYHPQKDSTLVVSGGSTISGYTGIALKGGTAYILDSTVQGIGATAEEAAFLGSGFSNTADGIYIETGYGYEIVLEVRNCTVTSAAGQAIQIYDENASHVRAVVYSGVFSSNVIDLCAPDRVCIPNAGTYVVSVVAGAETE